MISFRTIVTVIVAVVAVLSPNIVRMVGLLDLLKTVPVPRGDCDHLASEWKGFEDVSYVSGSSAIACAGHLWDVWSGGGPLTAPRSQCVLITLPQHAGVYPPAISVLRFVGYPPDAAQFYHGLSVHHNAADGSVRIFAVNHAHDSFGERIDAFVLDPAALTLTYVGSVTNPVLQTRYAGILNDVVVVNDTTLFVTAYLPEPDNKRGRTAPETFWEHSRHARMYAHAFLATLNTQVLRCKYALTIIGAGGASSAAGTPATTCEVAAHHCLMANGATLVRLPAPFPANVLVVSDTIGHQLRFLNVDTSAVIEVVDLVHAADNVEVDPTSYVTKDGDVSVTLYAGSVIRIYDATKIDKNPQHRSPGAATRIDLKFSLPTPGNITVAVTDQIDLIVHDGSKLSGTSSSLRLRHGGSGSPTTADDGVVILGSYLASGLLVCPMPKY